MVYNLLVFYIRGLYAKISLLNNITANLLNF